ncbi:hypothetical protein HRbin40_00546 [bacterium HR40]|nr:hypothetical protein HRbin40_00546 [bacterium HR40]
MTRGESESEEPFLARWSRLKRLRREEGEPADPQTADRARTAERAEEQVHPVDAETGGIEAEEGPFDVTKLPDPDTLDAGSDFRIFLRAEVPEELRIRALRRLWRVNPIIREPCPLIDFAEDYTDAATVVPDLQSVFKAGLRTLEKLAGEGGGREASSTTVVGSAERKAPPTEAEAAPATGPRPEPSGPPRTSPAS